jgi:hypothetical protein
LQRSHHPIKTIQVNFTDGNGKHIPMTTEAGNEQAFLDLLKKAKGVHHDPEKFNDQ